MVKLRLVFQTNKGKATSYMHLEKSEALRTIKILKILPTLKTWTPASKIARQINAKLPATLWTIQKLAGTKTIDIKENNTRKTIAKNPILHIKKEQHNNRNNLRKTKYLRATVYLKQ